MTKSSKLVAESKNSSWLGITKGVFWALSVSLISVLIFAFVIKFTNLPENTISPINQAIKVLSILVGCFVASKKIKNNGWLIGIAIGALYTLLAFLIFSILDGEFRFTISLLNDFVFGSSLGLISGVITFAFRK